MGIWKAFFNNTRKPEGLLGKCMVGSMNHAHAALADWGLSHLPETGPAKIAELGCAFAKISGCDYYCSGLFRNSRGKGQECEPRGTPSRPLPNFAG